MMRKKSVSPVPNLRQKQVLEIFDRLVTFIQSESFEPDQKEGTSLDMIVNREHQMILEAFNLKTALQVRTFVSVSVFV